MDIYKCPRGHFFAAIQLGNECPEHDIKAEEISQAEVLVLIANQLTWMCERVEEAMMEPEGDWRKPEPRKAGGFLAGVKNFLDDLDARTGADRIGG